MTHFSIRIPVIGCEIAFTGALSDYVRAVDEAVDKHKGRKRERTIHVYDALRAIVEAHRIGAATTGRQTVANRYGYPADYVSCDAIRREDGSVIWAVGRSGCSCSTVLGVSRIPVTRRGKQIDTSLILSDGAIPAECVAELAAIIQPKGMVVPQEGKS